MKTFPDFEISVRPELIPGTNRDGLSIDIQTHVRKKFKTKWYKVLVRQKYFWVYDPNTSFGDRTIYSDIFKDFYETCYRIQLLEKYNLDKLIPDNIDMKMIKFELDTDQRSEEDRLNNVIRYNKIKFV